MPLHPNHAEDWSAELTRALERPVRVLFGRARRNVVVVRTHRTETEVRLNEAFVEAPGEVRAALTQWMRSGKRARRACTVLDAWIADLGNRLGPPSKRGVRIRPAGEVYDLAEVAAGVLASEFPGELSAELATRVTWGRRGTRPARRSLQLGSYDPERDLVRIHPVLDQAAVPHSFVRYVVFHELLHARIDREVPESDPRRRRRRHHPPRFVEREQAYAGFEDAVRWQEDHLRELFRSARDGKPMRVRLRARARDGARSAWRTAQGWLFPDALTLD